VSALDVGVPKALAAGGAGAAEPAAGLCA